MTHRAGYTPPGAGSAFSGIGTPTDGDVLVGGGVRYTRLAVGPKGTILRRANTSGNVAWQPEYTPTPYDRGYVSESFRGDMNSNAFVTLSAGILYTSMHVFVEPELITRALINTQIQASGCTGSYIGFYQNGNLVGVSGDISAVLNGAGFGKRTATFGAISLAAGFVDIAILVSSFGAQAPQLNRGNNGGNISNGEAVGQAAFYATAGSGLSSMPATMPAKSPSNNSIWFATAK